MIEKELTAKLTPKTKLKLMILEADEEQLDRIIEAIKLVCGDE